MAAEESLKAWEVSMASALAGAVQEERQKVEAEAAAALEEAMAAKAAEAAMRMEAAWQEAAV